MLFDLKKMSKHLIGIDAEVYILYEDKVLLKSWEKTWLEAPVWFSFSFHEWHPFVVNRTAVISSSVKALILFLDEDKVFAF